jgi:hypothetical protein
MPRTYKFSVTIQDKKQTISPRKGVDIEDLGVLIQDLKKAIATEDGAYCTMYDISNHGYTPNFLTNSKKQYENFISLHENIYEKPFEDLRPKEVKYAKTLKSILYKGRYLETFDTKSKPIATIYASAINKPVATYNNITNVIGIVSEMGSPNFNKRTHIFVAGFDYKIYTNVEQDNYIKDFYRKHPVTLKIKQKRSIKTDKVISAVLINITPKTKGNLVENVSSLTSEDLSFLSSVNSYEDILKLIRV